MNASTDLIGESVIGSSLHNLNRSELQLVVSLADGKTPPQIAQALGCQEEALPLLEGRARIKLGALTQAHLIARAFLLNVLRPRSLVLAAICALVGLVAHALSNGQGIAPSAMAAHSNSSSAIETAADQMGAMTVDPRYEQMMNRRHR